MSCIVLPRQNPGTWVEPCPLGVRDQSRRQSGNWKYWDVVHYFIVGLYPQNFLLYNKNILMQNYSDKQTKDIQYPSKLHIQYIVKNTG